MSTGAPSTASRSAEVDQRAIKRCKPAVSGSEMNKAATHTAVQPLRRCTESVPGSGRERQEKKANPSIASSFAARRAGRVSSSAARSRSGRSPRAPEKRRSAATTRATSAGIARKRSPRSSPRSAGRSAAATAIPASTTGTSVRGRSGARADHEEPIGGGQSDHEVENHRRGERQRMQRKTVRRHHGALRCDGTGCDAEEDQRPTRNQSRGHPLRFYPMIVPRRRVRLPHEWSLRHRLSEPQPDVRRRSRRGAEHPRGRSSGGGRMPD